MGEELETVEVPVPENVVEEAKERSARYEVVFDKEPDKNAIVADILTERVFGRVQSES